MQRAFQKAACVQTRTFTYHVGLLVWAVNATRDAQRRTHVTNSTNLHWRQNGACRSGATHCMSHECITGSITDRDSRNCCDRTRVLTVKKQSGVWLSQADAAIARGSLIYAMPPRNRFRHGSQRAGSHSRRPRSSLTHAVNVADAQREWLVRSEEWPVRSESVSGLGAWAPRAAALVPVPWLRQRWGNRGVATPRYLRPSQRCA